MGRRPEPLPQFAIGQKAYVLHNVRLTYLFPNEQIGVSGWVRNLTDERYKIYAAQAVGFESLLNWIGDPRTYGLSVSIDW